VDAARLTAFRNRLGTRLVDPTLLMVPVVAAVFSLAARLDLISPTPIWILCVMLVAGFCLTSLSHALWADCHEGWQLWARVGVQTGNITAVMYAIGWGPMLTVGLVIGVVECIRISGTRAVVPAMVCSCAALGGGEVAIAAGIAPTLVPEPLVHGLAILAALGVIFTIKQFERSTIETERAQDELRQNAQRFRALVQNASDIIMVLASDGAIRYVSPAFETVLGYPASEALGMNGVALAYADDLDVMRDALVASSRQDRTVTAEIRLAARDGAWHWFDVIVTDLSRDPSVGGWVANLRDSTQRKAQEEALNEAQEAFRHAFDDAPIGIGLVAMDGRILRANRAMGVLFGRTQDDLVGRNVSDLTHPDDAETSDEQRDLLTRDEIDSYRLEKRYVRPDGSVVWAALSVSLVRDTSGQPLYTVGQLEDITDRKALADQLAHDAAHDAMTGLLNRASFTQRVAAALEARTNPQGRRVAVLFVDLDHFKVINDSLGHAVGDELVETIAERLRATLRPGSTVARFGGDEFVVLCEDLPNDDAAVAIAHRLLAAVAEPVALSTQEVFVSASIGIAIAAADATSDTLLRDADAAMYRAKNTGRARAVMFEPDLQDLAAAALRTGTDLHRALERDELVVHYQPITNLRNGRVTGFEALLRWNHPDRGLVSPSEFIPLAEETGLIVPIGAWMLEQALHQLGHWQAVRDAKGRRGKLAMNVNVSPRQLADPILPRTVARVLQETGVDPNSVCLELTENALMQESSAADALAALRGLGVHISIDDFGTGYSSLAYLKQFPVTALKIDRTFIEGLGTDVEDTSIVEAIVTLAHALGLIAVAEGLETATQLATLRAIGCDYAQGFLLGRPAPADRIGDSPADDLTTWHATATEA
jgi:diguanylate cyclase (GGDEF)-like protein/PAS domain S-box-containing protein